MNTLCRYHSKSQTSLLDVHNQSYDDSSLTRDKSHVLDSDQKSFSYATLPRKKRPTPATQQQATPVAVPSEAICTNGKGCLIASPLVHASALGPFLATISCLLLKCWCYLFQVIWYSIKPTLGFHYRSRVSKSKKII